MVLQSCRRETKSGWTNLAKQEDWAPSAWTTNRTHGGCSPNKSQANHSFHTQNMRRRRINEAYIFAGVGEVLKVRVVECLNRRDSLVRLVNKDLFEQITRQGRDLWVFLWQRNSWIVWEALNVFGRLTERIRRRSLTSTERRRKWRRRRKITCSSLMEAMVSAEGFPQSSVILLNWSIAKAGGNSTSFFPILLLKSSLTTVPCKHDLSSQHLRQNASRTPEVNWWKMVLASAPQTGRLIIKK